MVAGRGEPGAGAPGTSGLSEESCVALAGVVNTTFGTPMPELPAQPASESSATNLCRAREHLHHHDVSPIYFASCAAT